MNANLFPRSEWNHSACDECWGKFNLGEPYRLKEPPTTKCCYCGAENSSGLFVKENPGKTPCKGIHADPQDSRIEEGAYIDLKQYVLRQSKGFADRWIIVLHQREECAWSGFRWVPIGSSIPNCSFDSEEAAHTYASQRGLVPASAPSDEQIRAIWRDIANGVASQGDFLRCLGSAIVFADPENFPIIRQAAIFFIRKYQLESLVAASFPAALSPGKQESEAT
jgi:hypothetical protein